MATKKRKYNEEYISYGFNVKLDRDGTEKSQCFLCGKVLANTVNFGYKRSVGTSLISLL